MTDHDHTEILAYAEQHGTSKAAERYSVAPGTIRSWRSRERSDGDPTIKPGDAGYRVADLPSRFGPLEGTSSGASTIVTALEVARRESVAMAAQHVYVPRPVIKAWLARDESREPQVDPDDASTRMAYAFSSLPDDVRCALTAEIERAAWAYHAPDVEHVRIVQRREDEARAEREAQRHRDLAQRATERAAELKAHVAELDARQREWEAQAAKDAAEDQAARAASERARRASERARHAAQAKHAADTKREVDHAAALEALHSSPIG
ncbi:MAG: hypothetical protein ACR2IP_08215 [Solirubrobacteraceae bacterium]